MKLTSRITIKERKWSDNSNSISIQISSLSLTLCKKELDIGREQLFYKYPFIHLYPHSFIPYLLQIILNHHSTVLQFYYQYHHCIICPARLKAEGCQPVFCVVTRTVVNMQLHWSVVGIPQYLTPPACNFYLQRRHSMLSRKTNWTQCTDKNYN